jgi:hypothetical protein
VATALINHVFKLAADAEVSVCLETTKGNLNYYQHRGFAINFSDKVNIIDTKYGVSYSHGISSTETDDYYYEHAPELEVFLLAHDTEGADGHKQSTCGLCVFACFT